MKPIKCRIWWSPVGGPDGSRIVEVIDLFEARTMAYEEMRRHNDCGAYGAEPLERPAP